MAFSSAEGVLTLTNSTVSGNNARGGIVGIGGGILNFAGPLTLTNSTVSGNTAEDLGGGIFNDDGIPNNGTVTLTNSTVWGNTPATAEAAFVNYGTVTLTNSTVSGKTAGGRRRRHFERRDGDADEQHGCGQHGRKTAAAGCPTLRDGDADEQHGVGEYGGRR